MAYDYVQKNGLELESDYTYTARDGKCKYDATKVKTKISGHKNVDEESYDGLLNAVAQQPVAVAIEADSFVF